MLLLGVTFATPVCAQAPMPNWGAYDEDHNWRDAAWWYQTQPDWTRSHHPEWWGDFDSDRQWEPAWWWWRHDPNWVRHHHPEWWGDYYHGEWYPAAWWWQNEPGWVRVHHPEWWGDYYHGQWYPASWWEMLYASDSRAGSSRLVGRSLSRILVSRGLVVGESTRLVPRVSSRLVGRLLPESNGTRPCGGGRISRRGSSDIIPSGGAQTTIIMYGARPTTGCRRTRTG